MVADLAGIRTALLAQATALVSRARGTTILRIHGHFDLAAVWVAGGDAILTGFGHPALTPEQHRTKASPWQDVADVLAAVARLAVEARAAHRALPQAAGRDGVLADELLGAFRRRAEWALLGAYLHASPPWAGDRGLMDAQHLAAVAEDLAASRDAAAPADVAAGLLAVFHRLATRLCPLPEG